MKRRQRESRPTKFDVSIEKGDYKLPCQLTPKTDPFLDFLDSFITSFEWLGGHTDMFYWLGKWKDHHRDCTFVGSSLGVTADAVKKRIEALRCYYIGHNPSAGVALGNIRKNMPGCAFVPAGRTATSAPGSVQSLATGSCEGYPPDDDPFGNFLESFITAFEWLGGDIDILYWLVKWKDNDHNCKKVAAGLGVTPDAIRKRIYSLKKIYLKHTPIPRG